MRAWTRNSALRRPQVLLIGAIAAGLASLCAACTVGTGATNLLAQSMSPLLTIAADPDKVPDTEFAFYGNWCGPRYPPPENKDTAHTLPPVDALDTVCMKHDLCYRANGGRPSCRCNTDLIWRVKYLQHHSTQPDGDMRAAMTAMLAWFASAPCLDTADPGAEGAG